MLDQHGLQLWAAHVCLDGQHGAPWLHFVAKVGPSGTFAIRVSHRRLVARVFWSTISIELTVRKVARTDTATPAPSLATIRPVARAITSLLWVRM